MNKLSRRLAKAAPLILLGLLLDNSPVNPSAQALVGGPFDNNQTPGVNADGTYSGTLSGKNLIGMVTFGVSSSSEQNGRFAVFHEGFINYGAAAGTADLASRRVFCSLLGVAALSGNGFGGGITETTGGSGNVSTAVQTLTVRSSAEGFFTARMKNYPVIITFEGEGELSTVANSAVFNTLEQATSPNGVDSFITTITSPASPDTTVDEPSTAQATVGGQIQSSQIRSSTPFKVRGSRTSRTAYTVLNNYASVPPIAVIPNATPTGTATATATPAATATPTPTP